MSTGFWMAFILGLCVGLGLGSLVMDVVHKRTRHW